MMINSAIQEVLAYFLELLVNGIFQKLVHLLLFQILCLLLRVLVERRRLDRGALNPGSTARRRGHLPLDFFDAFQGIFLVPETTLEQIIGIQTVALRRGIRDRKARLGCLTRRKLRRTARLRPNGELLQGGARLVGEAERARAQVVVQS